MEAGKGSIEHKREDCEVSIYRTMWNIVQGVFCNVGNGSIVTALLYWRAREETSSEPESNLQQFIFKNVAHSFISVFFCNLSCIVLL